MERGRGWGCLAVGEVREQRAGKERVSEGERKRIQGETHGAGFAKGAVLAALRG